MVWKHESISTYDFPFLVSPPLGYQGLRKRVDWTKPMLKFHLAKKIFKAMKTSPCQMPLSMSIVCLTLGRDSCWKHCTCQVSRLHFAIWSTLPCLCICLDCNNCIYCYCTEDDCFCQRTRWYAQAAEVQYKQCLHRSRMINDSCGVRTHAVFTTRTWVWRLRPLGQTVVPDCIILFCDIYIYIYIHTYIYIYIYT